MTEPTGGNEENEGPATGGDGPADRVTAPAGPPEPEPPKSGVRGWFARLLGRSAAAGETAPEDAPFLFGGEAPLAPPPGSDGAPEAPVAPAEPSGVQTGGDDPTLNQRMDDLATALRDREQELRGVSVELEALGRKRSWGDGEAPASDAPTPVEPLSRPAPVGDGGANEAGQSRVAALEQEVARLKTELGLAQAAASAGHHAFAAASRQPPPALLEEMAGLRHEVEALREHRREREEMLLQAEASARNNAFALRASEQRVAALLEQQAAFQHAADTRSGDQLARLADAEAERDRTAEAAEELRAASARDLREAITAVDDIREEWDRAEARLLAQLEEQIRQIRTITADLSRREGDLEAAGERVRKAVEETERARAEAASERARSSKAMAELKERAQALARERESLSQGLADKSAAAADFEFKWNEQAAAAAKLAKDIERLQASRDEQLREMKRKLGEREGELAELRSERDLLARETADLRAQTGSREQRLRDVEARLLGSTSDKETRERDYIALRTRLESDISELRASLEDRERRVAFLQDQVEKAEMRCLDLEDKVRDGGKKLEGRTKELRDAFTKRDDEARKLTETLAAREALLARTGAEVKERERTRLAELDGLEGKVKEKDAQVNELLKMLESKTDALKAAEDARARTTTRLTVAEQQVRAAAQQIRAIEERAKATSEQARGQDEQARNADQQARATAARATALERDLLQATAKINALEAALGEMESAQAATAGLAAERDEAESARAMDSELIARLREAVAEREAQIRALRRQLADRDSDGARGTAAARRTPDRNRAATLVGSDGTSGAALEAGGPTASNELDGLFEPASAPASRRLPAAAAPAEVAGEPEIDARTTTARAATATRPPVRSRRPLLVTALLVGLSLALVYARHRGLFAPSAVTRLSAAPAAGAELTPALPADRDRALAVVRDWSGAIERRDWKRLLGLYHPGFVPPELPDRKSFEALTIETLRTADWLSVDLERLAVNRAPDGRLVISFPIELRARGRLDFGRRELWLGERDGKWTIEDDRWVAAGG